MNNSNSVEEKMCPCLCHIAPVDFNGAVCCDCHKTSKHPAKELIDKFESRISSLESHHLNKDHKDRHWIILECEKFESRIERIEQFHIRNFNEIIEKLENSDENKNIHKRIDGIDKNNSINEGHLIGLESRIERLESDIKDEIVMRKDLRDYCFERLGSAINSSLPLNVYERLKKLESDHLDQLNPHAFIILKNKINELEGLVNAIRDSYNNICAPSLRKEPFKCPACEGSGRYKLATAQCDSDIIDCRSCEGKGIVWG